MLIWPDHPAFSANISALRGVGPKTQALLNEEGFFTLGDILALSPKYYQDRRHPTEISALAHNDEVLIMATVVAAKARFGRRSGRRYAECVVEDQSGRLTLCWFNAPPYLIKSLDKGRRFLAFGRIVFNGRRLEMPHPDLEFLPDPEIAEEDSSAEPKLRPVYPAIGALSSAAVGKLVNQAVTGLESCPGLFPPAWLADKNLEDPVAALKILHRPPWHFSGPVPKPNETKAFRRLAFFELFLWRLLMLKSRSLASGGHNRPPSGPGEKLLAGFCKALPFCLSPEQVRALGEIVGDLKSARPMSRLLQGEVGGGKTAVAAAALFFAIGRGGQGALMAPTEVLARQHYDFLKPYAEALGINAVFLSGKLTDREKKGVRAGLADGSAQLAVGSQALLSAITFFKNLSLAVIDEQQRFGVRQRLALRNKSAGADLLTLSATPIPRSLALILYGDLDLSTIKGLLPGRRPAATSLFAPDEKSAAYSRFLELVKLGGQGFVVTPRIGLDDSQPEGDDASEEERLPSVVEIHQYLQSIISGDFKLAVLHGRLTVEEINHTMGQFREGLIDVLIATSIIEVGVDVPSARVILIEGAERFGLAQLHQLRGRVGRGGQEGHCLLLPGGLPGEVGSTRLKAMLETTDGQALAEMDLELRGPGEGLGLRQSGWPALTYARLPRDLAILAEAHRLAEDLWSSAPSGRHWLAIDKLLNFESAVEHLARTSPD